MNRKKILICSYRDWANKVKDRLLSCFKDHDFYCVSSKLEFSSLAKGQDFDLVLFIGWSWLVPSRFVDRNTCVCFHPSDLPKYRGGSPIQNQIIDGLTASKVTAFKMDDGLDSGPIYDKEPISLMGNLEDVLDDISKASTILAVKIVHDCINDRLFFYPQEGSSATTFKRRSPEQSEITIEDIQICTSTQLHNKIRALQYPYPNAFIVCGDGKKLFISLSRVED